MNNNKQVITYDGYKGYIEHEEGDKYFIYLYDSKAIYMFYREQFDYIKV